MCEGIINHHSFSLIVPARPTFSPSRKSQKYKETQRTIALKQKFEKKLPRMIVDAHIISTYSQYVCVMCCNLFKDKRKKMEVRKNPQNYNKERRVMKSQFEGRKQEK